MKTVGVFRDRPIDQVVSAAEELMLDAIQLHGREDEQAIADLRVRLPRSTEIWAVQSVEGGRLGKSRWADRALFDTAVDGVSGGTGSAFDWDILHARKELPSALIAGGIGPDNAAEAARLGAYALDVSSRVEAAPGIKDEAKVRALFDALRPKCRGDK